MIGGDDVEILVHIGARSTAQHDARYRQQAVGLLTFEPTRIHIIDGDGTAQHIENSVRGVQEDEYTDLWEEQHVGIVYGIVPPRGSSHDQVHKYDTSKQAKLLANGVTGPRIQVGVTPRPASGRIRALIQEEASAHGTPRVHVKRTPLGKSHSEPQVVTETPAMAASILHRAVSDSWETPPSVIPDSQPPNSMLKRLYQLSQEDCVEAGDIQDPSPTVKRRRLDASTSSPDSQSPTQTQGHSSESLEISQPESPHLPNVVRSDQPEPVAVMQPLAGGFVPSSDPGPEEDHVPQEEEARGGDLVELFDAHYTTPCVTRKIPRSVVRSIPPARTSLASEPLCTASSTSGEMITLPPFSSVRSFVQPPSSSLHCVDPVSSTSAPPPSSANAQRTSSPQADPHPSPKAAPPYIALPAHTALSIHPPPPPTALSVFATHLTPDLANIAQHRPGQRGLKNLYTPLRSTRPLRVWERGHWRFAIPELDDERLRNGSGTKKVGRAGRVEWDKAVRDEFWSFLSEFIGKGRAGWGVWAEILVLEKNTPVSNGASKKITELKTEGKTDVVRVWCWGEIVVEVWAMLFLASPRAIKGLGLEWVDAEGEVVVTLE